MYQIIASDDGGIDVERDGKNDCFLHIAGLSEPDKESFKALMLDISVHGGNTSFFVSCPI